MYIWQQVGWPSFTWDATSLAAELAAARYAQGRLLGRMEGLGFSLQHRAHLLTLTEDVLKTSEIEGEILPEAQVRSSIARRLGIEIAGMVPVDRQVNGIVEVLLDATVDSGAPLTAERLLNWHAMLFPGGKSGLRSIRAGAWRDDATGPMQVVSGPEIRQTVHFEAPPAARIPTEIETFLEWFHDSDEDPAIASGIAHLWFVTIHPFEDGNGRIARAISDLVMARSEGGGPRFYSMSAQIRRERDDYYRILEATQAGSRDISRWISWYLECLTRAIGASEQTLNRVLEKSRFWQRFAAEPLSERQIKMLNRILDGFEGKLTSSKWARMAGCSQDTAYRDIMDLMERGILKKNKGGGRSTSYSLVIQ